MIPFAALMDDEGKRLIEKHTIYIAPSVSVLRDSTDFVNKDAAGKHECLGGRKSFYASINILSR